ncbi:MAG: SurA N-terminal domain-containing protein, partial [Proteobacteria bacterium]|nr:SurA N-terminal domain-containing protein [Pseudomonadota bacterium]
MKSVKAVLMGVTAAVFMSLSAQASVADRIVAVVNDEVITLSELNGAFDPYRVKLEAAYEGQARDKALTEAREILLNRMIDALLMQQESRKTGIVVREEEVTEAIKDLLAKRNISQ